MAGFSIGEAVGAGFRVIREHPTAVLMWGLAYFVVTMAPMLAVGATMISDFAQLSEVAPSDAPSLEAFMTLQAKMMLLQAVQFVSTVAGAVILYGAIFRVVLEPQDKQHWYLRVGRQEMWLAFAYTVAMTLAIMAMFAAMIPVSIAGMVVGTTGGGAASWAVLVAAGIGVFGVCAWASIRLALAFPMTFAEQKFRMFESWDLTRGHAGRMATTFLIIIGLILLIELIVLVLFAVFGLMVLAMVGVTIPWGQGPEAQIAPPHGGWAPFLFVAIPGAALALSIVSAGLHAISVAPLAYVYRQLRPAQTSV